MAQVFLVCEGERYSVDLRLLDAILAQRYGLPVQIEPGGGANQPRIVRSWLEQRVPGDTALLIHDRDYEPLLPIQARWADATEQCLFWTAHEIENYLLEPWLIHELFEEYRRTIAAVWVGSLPPDAPAIEAVLQVAACRLFNDHVGRLLCGELRRHKTTLGNTEINIPAVDPLAGTPADWQAGIQAQIAQLQMTCAAVTATPHFQAPNVLAAWTRIEGVVTDPAFLASGQYRQEMKGKRLINLFCEHLRRHCHYPGTEDRLTEDLITTARRVYRSVTAYTFTDFDNLANRLRVAAGLPTIP
jgi:hypothetical protein